MPSARDCADRLREQAYKTIMPQIQSLEEELQKVSSLLSTGIRQVENKLDALRHTELPATELVLDELLGDAIRKRDLEGNSLSLFTRELRSKETQEEILTLLLDTAINYYPRVALFAIRGDRFVGWSSRGFAEACARSISSDSFLQSECPQFQEAFEAENPATVAKLAERDSLRLIQEESQGPWRLFPLRVLQRPVAVLVVEEVDGVSCRPEAVSMLLDCTALRLENIALKILNALSAAKPEAVYQAESAAASVAPAPVIPSAASVGLQPEPEQPEQFAEIQESLPAIEPKPIEVPAQETQTPSFAMEEPAASPVGISIPPSMPAAAPIAQPQPVPQPVPEEEKLHSDAKRFARLLVSEIKLYNEHHVVEGRQNCDLYLRLKKDIDRSREMYEKRVSPTVARKIDYFHDEIVRILGDNDTSTLGSDYPGPRIES